MSYKIVFFDIDGTLINEEKKIPEDTKTSIRKLRDNNIEVVIATGRAPYHLRHIAAELGIDSYVGFNGSYVVYKGQLIYEKTIDETLLESLDHHASENLHPIVYMGKEKCYTNKIQHSDVVSSFQRLNIDIPSYHPNYWKETKIYQAMLYCGEHEQAQYQQFSSLSFVRGDWTYLDVFSSGETKAKGIEIMLDLIEISPADAVAFGDGLNDKEMLSFVGMGIAMGNAHESIKPLAKFTTKHVNEGGIRYGLQKINMV